MKSAFRLQILMVIAVIWVVGIFVVQLYMLPQIREQVAAGLHAGLQEIAQQIARELSESYETQLKSDLRSLAIDQGKENLEDRLAKNSIVVIPDSLTKSWKRSMGNVVLLQVLNQRLPAVYDHWNPTSRRYWENTIDSVLLIFDQPDRFSPTTRIACFPVFEDANDLLVQMVCKEVYSWEIDEKIVFPYFENKFWPNDTARKDGIRKSFINIKIKNEKNEISFNSGLLSSGKIEARIPIRQASRYLELYTVEVGFWGKDSKGVAASLHQKNITLVVAVFAVLLLLLGLIFYTLRRAKQLESLKTGFLANITHELKTPLASIRLANDTLRLERTQSPAEAHRASALIHIEAQRLEKLITRLLDFSQMEAGKRNFQMERIDFSTWWENWFSHIEERLRLQGFEVISPQNKASGYVFADPEALEEALDILIDNAVKYSGNSRKIAFQVHTDDTEWSVSVNDFGIGISPNDQRLIFEKFVRLNHPDIHDVKGYGIGLALASAIMDAHNGRITVESSPGNGSVFSLIFPNG